MTALKIGDFACGTGTLLSTVYARLGQYIELHGGNSENLHADMMASVLVGADVLPAAAHLTAAMLSGAHPTIVYTGSHIMTVPYGAQRVGLPALGSLNLLMNQQAMDAVAAVGLGAKGAEKKDAFVSVAHGSFDLIVMNPPFTRATGQEAKKVGVPNPMFAAFGAGKDAQVEMKKAFDQLLAKLRERHSCDGQAGEASAFIELAHLKLKAGGRMGLITPLSLMSGEAWDKSRRTLAEHYDDHILLSIAGRHSKEMSFSADTGMGEAMTIATKRAHPRDFVVREKRPPDPLPRATFVVLDATIGGRAWMTLRFPDARMEASVALWGNTSLGLLLHWWQANKQQAGRGNVGKQALAGFSMLDPAALNDAQLDAAAALLQTRANMAMRPFNEVDSDVCRAELDRAFLVSVLGLPESLCAANGPLALLRRKLAAEPSVSGLKKSAAS